MRAWLPLLIVLAGCSRPSGTDASFPSFADASSAPDAISAVDADALDAEPSLDARVLDAGLTPDAETPDASIPSEEDLLVVVSFNTHSFQEGPSSPDKLVQIGEGLGWLQADIVGLNEVMSGDIQAYDFGGRYYDGAAVIRGALERAAGSTFHAYSVPFGHWDRGEAMSNVILSRYPILAHDERPLTTTDFWPGPTERRRAIFAVVDVPRVGLVNVFVTHTAGTLSSAGEAATQIHEVKAFVAEKRPLGPTLELVIGDRNVRPEDSLYAEWLDGSPLRLVDTFVSANPGVSVETAFGFGRIDYVLEGAGLLEPSASRVAFDGAELPRLSDHKAVITVFETGG